MNKIIIVAGPTASGKSDLAIQIAKMLDSEIISADSMQIYKGMDIGTAKITKDEMSNISHHMIDIINPDEEFSVSDYSCMAKNIIDNLHLKGKIPVICGGTGLYIDSILYPLSLGAKDDELRSKLQKELELYGPKYMHDKLKAIDEIEAEKVHMNNTKRVLRALEIYELTGKIKSDFNDRDKNLNYNTLLLVLNPDRDVLYDRINKRVDWMFENGLLDEVKNLLDKGYSFDMQSLKAIGYKEFCEYFVKNLTLDEVKDAIKKESRHYAKRQVTWFKRYPFANYIDNNINQIKEIVYKFKEQTL